MYDITLDFANCRFQGQSGLTFTVNGAPDLSMTGDWQWNGSVFMYDYAMNGGFAFTTSDGRAGSCSINYTGSFNGATGASSASGSFCGISFSS